jgi:hypothetical protein
MTYSILCRRAGLRILACTGVAIVAVGTYAVSADAAAGHAGHPARAAAPGRIIAANANSIVSEWHDQYGTIVITQTGQNTYTDTAVTELKLIGGSTCTIPAGTSEGTITGKGENYTGWLNTYEETGTGTCPNAGVASFGLTLSGNQLNESGEIWTRVNLKVTTTSLPSAKLHKFYVRSLGATGGDFPYYEWAVSAGALPKGLTLNVATGVISGTPTKTGTATFTITVSDLGEVSRPVPAGNATRRLTLKVVS